MTAPTAFDATVWVRPEIAELRAYALDRKVEPSKARYRLDQNEVSWDVPNALKDRALARLRDRDWSKYPTMHADGLRTRLAERHEVSPDGVLVGNGSGELVAVALDVFGGPGREVLGITPSFELYEALSRRGGARTRFLPSDRDLRLPLAALEEEIERDPRRPVVLCSPNNPTGDAATVDQVERLLQRLEAPLLLDNAYGEFCAYDYRPLLARYPQLLLFRTLSKAWSLAGARVGYVLCHPDVARELLRLKLPYNVGAPAAALAETALDHPGHAERCMALLRCRRDQWISELRESGVETFRSEANFVLIRTPGAHELASAFAEAGILVRDVGAHPLLADCLRITVGGAAALRAILTVIRRFVRARTGEEGSV